MAARVTTAEVLAASQIDASLGAVVVVGISVATTIVDDHLQGLAVHSEAMLRNIELYLACHFALLGAEKGPKATETIGDATDRFHDIYDAGLSATRFGQQALLLDSTGTLAGLSAKAKSPKLKALFTVVGTPPPPPDEEDLF